MKFIPSVFVFIRFKGVWGPALNLSLLGSLRRNCVAPVYKPLITHLPSIRYEEFLRVLKEVARLMEILRDFLLLIGLKQSMPRSVLPLAMFK